MVLTKQKRQKKIPSHTYIQIKHIRDLQDRSYLVLHCNSFCIAVFKAQYRCKYLKSIKLCSCFCAKKSKFLALLDFLLFKTIYFLNYYKMELSLFHQYEVIPQFFH